MSALVPTLCPASSGESSAIRLLSHFPLLDWTEGLKLTHSMVVVPK
jgi:hypothetical protein